MKRSHCALKLPTVCSAVFFFFLTVGVMNRLVIKYTGLFCLGYWWDDSSDITCELRSLMALQHIFRELLHCKNA